MSTETIIKRGDDWFGIDGWDVIIGDGGTTFIGKDVI